MAVFLVRRVIQALVVLLLVTVITFMLLRLIPGNVAVEIMGPGAYRNPAAIRLFDTTYGFNSAEGRTWMSLIRPDGCAGPEVTREVLNSALASLGRPALGG